MAAAKALNLRFVSKIKVVFNPFQWETASARSEFTLKLRLRTIPHNKCLMDALLCALKENMHKILVSVLY